jgi:hypothetical protein
MATLAILIGCGDLIALGGGLNDDEQPERLIYAFPHVVNWLDEVLPALKSFYSETDLTPIEQMDILLHDFVSGADFSYYERSHSMTPLDRGVWELKTTDLRIFGWFIKRGVFVAANIDAMDRIKSLGLYTGYRDNTVYRRNHLNLDEPKFLIGGYDDAL